MLVHDDRPRPRIDWDDLCDLPPEVVALRHQTRAEILEWLDDQADRAARVTSDAFRAEALAHVPGAPAWENLAEELLDTSHLLPPPPRDAVFFGDAYPTLMERRTTVIKAIMQT